MLGLVSPFLLGIPAPATVPGSSLVAPGIDTGTVVPVFDKLSNDTIYPASKRAWVTMLFGNSRNGTMLVEVQLRSLWKLKNDNRKGGWNDHITMVTPEVYEATRKKLRQAGSQVIEVNNIEMPHDAMANVGETMRTVRAR